MKEAAGLSLAALVVTCLVVGANGQSTNSTYGTLPQATSNSSTIASTVDTSGIQQLFVATTAFVNVVLVPSLADLRNLINTYVVGTVVNTSLLTQNWNQVASLLAGLAACIIAGFLFIVFVPLVGSIMCCCRCCCDNCGGKMKQSMQRRKSKWQYCFTASLLIITIFIFAPAVLVFYTSSLTTDVVTTLPNTTVSILDYAQTYLDTINSQLAYVVTQYGVFSATVTSELSNLRASVGNPIQSQIRSIATPTIDIVTTLESSTSSYVAQLNIYQTQRNALASIATDISTFKSDFAIDFPNDAACSGSAACITLRTTTVPALTSAGVAGSIDALTAYNDGAAWATPHGVFCAGYASAFDTPLNIIMNNSFTNNGISSSVQSTLASSQTTVEQQTTGQTAFVDLGTFITNAKTDISALMTSLKSYDYYRWVAALVLSLFVLLICLFYFLGMVFGFCCGSRKKVPTKRGTLSNIGGLLLMSSVGLIFIFSWILMILVLLLFVIGSPIDRYVCQGLVSPYDGLKLVDDFVNLNLGSGISTNITSLVTNCENDSSAINALGLGNTLNLNTVKTDVVNSFQTTNIDVSVDLTSVYKLNNAQLISAVNALGVSILDVFPSSSTSGVTDDYTPALNEFQTAIDQSTGTVATTLTTRRDELQALQTKYTEFQAAFDYCKTNGALIESNRTSVISTATAADEQIVTNLDTIISTQVGVLRTTLLGHVTTYMDWVILETETNLGKCSLIYQMYSEFVSLFCGNLINLMNAFWFCLGWIVAFLIPSAILAMKLAKFYRRMDETDHVDPPEILMGTMPSNETHGVKLMGMHSNKVAPTDY